MQTHWWWWGLAVVLGVLELSTGTLYLLVVATGFAVGGLLAWLGAGFTWQLLAAAAMAVAAWVSLRRWLPSAGRNAAAADADLAFDVGQHVHVARWEPDRTARVDYRGTTWTAALEPGDPAVPSPGAHVIRRLDGARLIVSRLP